MTHKLRQCKTCGRSFVDRAENLETCFECRQASRKVVLPEKTSWVSPPFKVRFEAHDDSDLPSGPPVSPPSRPAIRLRDKLILAGAIILFYFVWPVAPLDTPENQPENQIALNQRPQSRTQVPQPPDPAPREQQQPTAVQEK
jgi:hypothetical protein